MLYTDIYVLIHPHQQHRQHISTYLTNAREPNEKKNPEKINKIHVILKSTEGKISSCDL